MAKPCRLTFQAFKKGENNLGSHYEIQDLENSRDYALWLLHEGYREEPHDAFDLAGFVEWCNWHLTYPFVRQTD